MFNKTQKYKMIKDSGMDKIQELHIQLEMAVYVYK